MGIIGSIRKIIFESNNSPYKVGLFKVKDTNDPDMIIYKDKVIDEIKKYLANIDYCLMPSEFLETFGLYVLYAPASICVER